MILRKFIVLSCMLVISIMPHKSLRAQASEIERLTEELTQQEGAGKLDIYSELSFHYARKEPAKGLYYGKKALELADSLRLAAAKSKAGNNIGLNFYFLAQYDSAQIYTERALQYAIQYNDTLQKANAFNLLGVVYEKKPAFDSALYAFHQALELYKQLGNDKRAGVANENIGTIHIHRGEETSALNYLLEAKAFYEAAEAINRLPGVYVRLGRIYSEDGNFTEAEKWFLKTIELAAEQENYNIQGIAINALGIMYKNQGRYEEALEKYLEAISFHEKINNRFLLAAVYNNTGNVYDKLGDHRKALDFLGQALDVYEILNRPMQIATTHTNMGNAFLSLGEYSNAIVHLEKALPVFTEARTWTNLLAVYRGLITANSALKAHEKTVKYFQEYVAIKDSLNQMERITALDSIKVMFQTEQIMLEATMLEQSNQIQAKTIARQQVILLSAFTVFILLIGFIVMVVHNTRSIKQANALLASKNEEITVKAKELEVKNREMQEHAKFKERMNAFLVHDLKNPLNAILNINEFNSDQAKIIRQSGFLMLNIVSNLLDVQKYEHTTMKPALEDISLSQVIHRAIREISYLAKQKSLQINFSSQSDFMLRIDPEITKRVFVNIFTNAIKFSETGGQIRIFAEASDTAEVKVTIEDDGEGISPDYLPFVFEKFSQGTPRSSGYDVSTGIGLTFCKMAVEAHGGEIGAIAGKENGAAFWFTLPLSDIQEKTSAIEETVSLNAEADSGLQLTASEKTYLRPFCEKLKSVSVFHHTDVKIIAKGIDGETGNLFAWKSLLMDSLKACNEPMYQQVINLCYDDPV